MMRHVLSLSLLLFTTLPLFAQSGEPWQEEMDWHSFEAGIEQAEQTQRPLLVYIYAPWCPYCKKTETMNFTDASVKEAMQEHFELAYIDATVEDDTVRFRDHTLSSAQLARAFGTRGYPNFIFLSAEGDYLRQQSGFMPADVFRDIVTYMGSGAYAEQSWQEFLDSKEGK